MLPLRGTVCAMPFVVSLAGCGVSGVDPTGAVAMIQFEQHRRASIRMQQEATSARNTNEIEANLRTGIEFCKQNIDSPGCRDVVRDEAKILKTARDMKKIGSR
jgi:hypothetical protein